MKPSCVFFFFFLSFPTSPPPFVSLFNIHKCNPLNLKSFPAQVNECNHKPMVAKPQEHMNKSAEGGKKGGRKKKRGEKCRGRSGTKLDPFTPQVSPCSPHPENVIGLTRGVVVGSLA